MLKALTILLGLFIIVSRGLILVAPTKGKALYIEWFSNPIITRGFGLFFLIFSILVFFAVKASKATLAPLMSVLGVVLLLAGIWLVLLPAQYSALVNFFMQIPDPILRILGGLGVLIGVLLVILGIKYY
jgi:uncharacterized protein YjeT (DUF2065 family)